MTTHDVDDSGRLDDEELVEVTFLIGPGRSLAEYAAELEAEEEPAEEEASL